MFVRKLTKSIKEMKKIKLTGLLMLSFLTFSLTSCESDSNDGNNNNEVGESTGDYWPLAVGNSWNYTVEMDSQSQDDSEITIIGNETINGVNAFKFNNLVMSNTATDGTMFDNLDVVTYSYKEGGDYHIGMDDLNAEYQGMMQLSQDGYDYIVLKDYLEVGETWNTDFTVTTNIEYTDPNYPDQEIDQTMELDGIILERDSTVEVNGETYYPVIKVGIDMLSDSMGQQVSYNYTYYFAENVGMIKMDGVITDGSTSTHMLQELETYSLN